MMKFKIYDVPLHQSEQIKQDAALLVRSSICELLNSYIVCFSSIGCAGELCAGGREFESGRALTLNFFVSLFLCFFVCV